MLRAGTQDRFIRNRVNMPTEKSHAELVSGVSSQIKARAFFSARVAEAHILDRLRDISDRYSRGEMGLGEARNILKDFLRGEGMDPHQAGMRNLASTGRLNLILRQNAAMAKAAGEWKRMHDPDQLAVFPYVRYHSRNDGRTRGSHDALNGKIFDKNDPFLKTHTPPWEFNCRCWLEEITAKEAGDNVEPLTKPEDVRVESESGFSFDPAHAFETYDLTHQTPVSRARIIEDAAEAVKDQKLGNVGLIAAPPTTGNPPVALPNLPQVKQGFDAMKSAAEKELRSVGLNPASLPDYKTVNQIFSAAGKQGKNIPGSILDHFPKDPFKVAKLNKRAEEAAGLPADVPVMLGRGNSHHGISHLWRDHKELFVDPDKAIRLLQETLGDPNCRVVVSLKSGRVTMRGKKTDFCLRRIVLHNPKTQTYCVMVYDGQELKLVSWNNAGDDYGNEEWTLA